jgi:hypothetical protein
LRTSRIGSGLSLPPVQGGLVFVDDSGHRGRRLGQVMTALAAIALAYVALVVLSLARLPGVPALSLPGVGSVLPGVRLQAPPSLDRRAVVTALPAPVPHTNDPAKHPSPASSATIVPHPSATTPSATTPTSAQTTVSTLPATAGTTGRGSSKSSTTVAATSTTLATGKGHGPPPGHGPPTSLPGGGH